MTTPPVEPSGGPAPMAGPTSAGCSELAGGCDGPPRGGGGGGGGGSAGAGGYCSLTSRLCKAGPDLGGLPTGLFFFCSFLVAAASTEGGSSAGGEPSPLKKGLLQGWSPEKVARHHLHCLHTEGQLLLAGPLSLLLVHVGWVPCVCWLLRRCLTGGQPCKCPPCHRSSYPC